jgi:hypothetical protein
MAKIAPYLAAHRDNSLLKTGTINRWIAPGNANYHNCRAVSSYRFCDIAPFWYNFCVVYQTLNTMTRSLFYLFLFALLMVSCERVSLPVDSEYPTTYYVIRPSLLSQLRSNFATKNRYMVTSVNEFGFCNYLDDLLHVDSPPILTPLTKPDAIEVVKSFVSNNKFETGINNPDDLAFYNISSGSGYGGAIGWVLKTVNQKVDTIEVLNSVILFHLTNREITSCLGNWFPTIYIPKKFNFSQTSAKYSLINHVVTHYSIAGVPSHMTISKTDVDQSTMTLKILPVQEDDRIELSVNWQIYIPGVSYIIYVDVMTGKINGEEPTIIS